MPIADREWAKEQEREARRADPDDFDLIEDYSGYHTEERRPRGEVGLKAFLLICWIIVVARLLGGW